MELLFAYEMSVFLVVTLRGKRASRVVCTSAFKTCSMLRSILGRTADARAPMLTTLYSLRFKVSNMGFSFQFEVLSAVSDD
jgi:hypothetical protein